MIYTCIPLEVMGYLCMQAKTASIMFSDPLLYIQVYEIETVAHLNGNDHHELKSNLEGKHHHL